MVDVWKNEDMILEDDPARYCQVSTEDSGGGGGGGGGGNAAGNNNNNTGVHGIVMDKDEKRMRREIANSNERRRMQSINAGFQSLRQMLPHHEGEKLSKAAILQQTAEYIYTLEQEKTRLLSQNCQLKRLLDQHDHNGAVAAAELQQATTQTAQGVTVLTSTAAAAAVAAAATTATGTTGASGTPVAAVAQVATVAKKRKIDAIIAPVSDSSDEGLGSMSPEPVSLMQVVSSATGTTLVATAAAVNGRACQAFNVSAKDYLDLKHQLDIERRQKAVFEERLKALERQIYPARVLYQDHPDMVESSETVEEVLVPTITKAIASKLAREPDSVQLIALDAGVVGKKQLVVCGPEVLEETVQQPIAKSLVVTVKEEKKTIKRSRSQSPANVETVVTLPPKKNRYPTILEAAIKAEPKVEVERIDSPSSIVVSEDRLSHLTSSKLATPQQQQAASRINTCRHNLETIVEAIRHLEGDAFDNVVPPQQHLQGAVVARPVQDAPLALTTSSKHQIKQERDHRQSQLEPYLKFRTPPAVGGQTASSATSAASSSSASSSNPSSNPSGNPAIVSVSITPTITLAAVGSSSSSPSASSSSAQQTASQILQHHQQCRPGVIVVKQTS